MLLSKVLVLLLLCLMKLVTITNSCCSNFKSLGSLGVGEDETFSGYQILYPPFNFTCNNSQIIKFIFSGEINGVTFSNNQGRISKIQLWQRNSFTDYTIIKSWDLNQNDVTQRNDNLLELDLIDSEGNGPAVNADTVIGIFLPSRRRKQVDLFFTRSLSYSDHFYYKSASFNPSSSLNIAQMTIGDETYPKMTVELSNTLCSTTTDASIIITTMILTNTIVKSTLPNRPTTTVVTRSSMTSTMNHSPNRSTRSSLTTAVSHNAVTSSAKIFSTVPACVTTITVFSKTQSIIVSLTSKSVPSSSAIIIQITSSDQTKRSSQAESPTVGPSNSRHMSNEPQTSSQDPSSISVTSNTPPPIISTLVVGTTDAVTTGTSNPIEGIGLSGYIIATVVSSAGFLVVCLILFGIAFYAVCLRKQRSSNPVPTEQSLSFSRRPQSQTSMYSNNVYLMNKLKKKEFIPTANNSSPSHHHYDTPNFTQSKESEESENRYSTLNRLSQFNRNPAYSIASNCTLNNDNDDNSHDYEEV
ncbi:PREDICTED: uncharacterized protein LOC109581966 isoform X1 [Amphimedon queenslandica]|uniref:CUB domain-containing protein n=1 Tax=Amphimedon queenslandica TaxID=400682 RepID=A0A1X7VTP6_AMPQE|nr:PREDICTED: uncharacterized protein LOC109581966 isoform X1 [Amphimedon queenslandica]|eukprot:XP_019852049.1 PREDICTED: uncharacterized protein LOC109581966 isoform X1 [Amphimedon queenslandica]